jgi:ABC-type multidrug transport system fused ATPase/permease subunit
VSLLRILERDRLLDHETLARLRWLQWHKGHSLEEALGPAHAQTIATAAARLERERRRLSLAGIWRVFSELRHYPGALSVLLLLSVASTLFSFPFVFSWYLGTVLNHLLTTRDISSLVLLTAVAATVLMTSTVMDFLLSAWASRCNFYLNQTLMMRAWQRLLHMPFPLYQRQDQGALMNKLTQVLEVLGKHQLNVLRTLMYALCILVATIAVLVYFHFAFTLLLFPAVLTTYIVPVVISRRADRYLRQEPRMLGRVSNFLQVAFSAHWVLRLKGLEAMQRRLAALAGTHFLNQAGKWLAWNLGYNSKVTLNLLSFMTMIWGGGALYLAGAVHLSEFVTVYLLVTMVTPKLDELYRLYVSGQALRTNYEALDELLELPVASPAMAAPLAADAASPEQAPITAIRSLQLEGVSFRYRPDGAEVLRDVSLELRRGQGYAVTGRSGAGKSTLVDLLLGLLAPDSGRLLINGEPLTEQARPALWSRVSLHEQSNFVFLDRTAEANLAPPPSGDAKATAWRQLADRLELPRWGGLRATELSGGERQRLCLLRTLAKPADVYVFDEPTSALDRTNAAIVLTAIASLREAIVLVISHDPAVVEAFPHVLQVEAGRVTPCARADGKSLP